MTPSTYLLPRHPSLVVGLPPIWKIGQRKRVTRRLIKYVIGGTPRVSMTPNRPLKSMVRTAVNRAKTGSHSLNNCVWQRSENDGRRRNRLPEQALRNNNAIKVSLMLFSENGCNTLIALLTSPKQILAIGYHAPVRHTERASVDETGGRNDGRQDCGGVVGLFAQISPLLLTPVTPS